MTNPGLLKNILSFLLSLFILSQLYVQTGCANIIPPQGGPRDSIPPRLIKASPGDSTRNFTGNRIVLSFDEFVDVQTVQQNLMISPTPGSFPSVDVKLNTITVRIKDTLEANTTYSINFGSAIKDYNEGNVLKDYTYIFSTGPYIDSLELTGKVVLAETGQVDTNVVVMLHTSDRDSALITEKPRYVAKLDSKGQFKFSNLPPRTFYLYALKDEGGTRRYFNDKQLFAFAEQPVVIGENNEPVTLYAHAAPQATVTTPTPATSPGNNKNRGPGLAIDKKRLKYQANLVNNQQDLLRDFILSFEVPLKTFDSTKILLYTDSVFTPAVGYRFALDSSRKKLQLQTTWKENTDYRIIMDVDFAEDTVGNKLLKSDTLAFQTKKLTDYGSLQLKFRNLDMNKNPVLLFVQNGMITHSFTLSGPELTRSMFLPGEYELRILYDNNKNGVWDPGEFFGVRRQPEIVQPVERKINVKPNWKNEFEIAL